MGIFLPDSILCVVSGYYKLTSLLPAVHMAFGPNNKYNEKVAPERPVVKRQLGGFIVALSRLDILLVILVFPLAVLLSTYDERLEGLS